MGVLEFVPKEAEGLVVRGVVWGVAAPVPPADCAWELLAVWFAGLELEELGPEANPELGVGGLKVGEVEVGGLKDCLIWSAVFEVWLLFLLDLLFTIK